MKTLACLTSALSLWGIHGYRVEVEGHPNSFAQGETIKLKVNRMTSRKTFLRMDYSQLPFCLPEGNEVELDDLNFGQILSGDRILSSPYRLKMKEDMYCEPLCIGNLGREEKRGSPPNKMVQAIRNNYHHNWIVDNLPAAHRWEDDATVTTRYWGGTPLGFIAADIGRAFIHNHVNIQIQYHNVETEPDRAIIVGFVMQPFSTRHDFQVEQIDPSAEDDDEDGDNLFKRMNIRKPINSCNRKMANEHTSYEMIYDSGREPQPASGAALFTYDVIWIENKDLDWASRWNVYIDDDAIPARVHWLSIANSLVVMIALLAIIATILIRNLRRGTNHFKGLATDEAKAEAIVQFGWKLVHEDVFRIPRFSPLLLSACCGSGSQLICTAFWTILLSAVGILHPAKRGHLIMALLALFFLNGIVAGYVTARFYKTFKGKNWQKAAACAAFGFPGLLIGFWLMVDMVTLQHVPTMTVVVILSVWIFVSTPLVYVGTHLGYKRDPLKIPVSTSRSCCPRPIPSQRWLRRLPVTFTAAAALGFGVIFVEFFFAITSVWRGAGYYYGSFGFLLLVCVILAITCAAMTVVLNYIQLCGENYHWWWRSFIEGGSTGLAAFIWSCKNVQKIMDVNSFSAFAFYIGCMGLASLGLFLMTGFIGVSACMWFNQTMFASIGGFPNSSHCNLNPGNATGAQMIVKSGGDNDSGTDPQPNSRTKKALAIVFAAVALLSSTLVRPSHLILGENDQQQWNTRLWQPSDTDRDDLRMDRTENDAFISGLQHADRRFSFDQKMHKTYTPYVYGLANLLLTNYEEQTMVVAVLLWAAIVALSVMLKRRSARPGGKIYQYNQRQVHKILSERRRQLRDILNDPILSDDMKSKFGDLTSLLCIVADWQEHGFQEKKDECIKIQNWVVVPWIRNMNVCLFLSTPFAYFTHSFSSIMILMMISVHLIDNLILYKAATVKGAPKIAESKSLFAAVGIPVIEIV